MAESPSSCTSVDTVMWCPRRPGSASGIFAPPSRASWRASSRRRRWPRAPRRSRASALPGAVVGPAVVVLGLGRLAPAQGVDRVVQVSQKVANLQLVDDALQRVASRPPVVMGRHYRRPALGSRVVSAHRDVVDQQGLTGREGQAGHQHTKAAAGRWGEPKRHQLPPAGGRHRRGSGLHDHAGAALDQRDPRRDRLRRGPTLRPCTNGPA